MTKERMTKDEALKLAMDALTATMSTHGFRDAIDEAHDKAITAIKEVLAQPEQEPVSDRENSIIRFALHQFMSNAYHHLNAAAQDKDYRRYSHDAAEKFAKDAKDAEALLGRLQFTTPPQRKPLTDEHLRAVWEPLQDALCLDYKVFARAVEAAHGIKE